MRLSTAFALAGLATAALAPAVRAGDGPDEGHFEVAQLSETPFFQRLFGGGRREEPPKPGGPKILRPPAGGAAVRPGQDLAPGPTTPKKIVPRKPAPVQPAKDADARVVLVIGDRLAEGLARGLDVAFADTPKLTIENAAVSPSGLAVPGTDWPKRLAERFAAPRPPDVVVVMTGVDDRLPLTVDGVEEPFRSVAWEKVYTARARAVVSAAVDRHVPLYWVGLVPMADVDLTTDMAFLDETYRKVAGQGLGHYVDVWNAFADDVGSFVASGPDVGGQERQLRLKDGIGFSKSGQRKLAFYVEQELRGWLAGAAVAAAQPRRTAAGGLVVSLTDPDAGDDDLVPATAAAPPREGSPLYRLVVLGQPPAPRVGRVDDLGRP